MAITPVSSYRLLNNSSESNTQYLTDIDGNSVTGARQISNFAPYGSTSMTVNIMAGHIFDGVTLTEVSSQVSSALVAPVSNTRIDRIVIDSLTGSYQVVAGSAAVSPTPPAIPAGKIPVAQVLLSTATTSLGNSTITDERDLNKTGFNPVQLLQYAVDTGAANAYVVAPTPAISSYTAGMVVLLKPANANMGASTISVSGLSAKNIKLPDGSDPGSGTILTTSIYQLVYNGTYFVLNTAIGTAGYSQSGYATNRYYAGNLMITNAGAGTVKTANQLYISPLVLGGPSATFTRIGITVITPASAGKHAHLGIYNMADGVPTTLLLDAGTVAVDSSGEKEVTISQSLSAGNYALVNLSDGAPAYCANSQDGSAAGNDFFGESGSLAAYITSAYSSQTYGSLPSSWPGTLTYLTGNNDGTFMWLRVV